jgi:heme exporter protein D
MLNKNKGFITLLVGASAAAVAVLSVGGYLLHRKVLKYRLQEQARQLTMFDMGEEFEDDYEDGDDDFYKGMLGDDDFDEDGFYKSTSYPAQAVPITEQEDTDR